MVAGVRTRRRWVALLAAVAMLIGMLAMPTARAAEPDITGAVTVGGLPLEGGRVFLFAQNAAGAWEPVESTATGTGSAAGQFAITPPGSGPYVAGFSAVGARAEFSNDKATPASADQVSPGDNLTVDLEPLTSISGTVTEGGTPAESVQVTLLLVRNGETVQVAQEFTGVGDSAGQYVIYPPGFLPPGGTYYLHFAKIGWASEYYDDIPAIDDTLAHRNDDQTDQYVVPDDATPVTEGSVANADLAPAPSITGLVTEDGAPSEGAFVTLYRKNAEGTWIASDTIITPGGADAGRYTLYLPNPAETYLVSANKDGLREDHLAGDSDQVWPERWYNDSPTLAGATELSAGDVADINLRRPAAVTGQVTSGGTAIEGARVFGFRDTGDGVKRVADAITDGDGNYSLPAGIGPVTVLFVANGYTAELYDDARTLGDATIVDVQDNAPADAPQFSVNADLAGGSEQVSQAEGLQPRALRNQISGSGVQVTNLETFGDDRAIGVYRNLRTVNSTSGLVLSTGQIADALGPNRGVASTDFGLPGDTDLDALAGEPTFDAAGVVATIIPEQASLTARFLMASEEYQDDGSAGNASDAVGIFVNGENCAVVPETDQAVSVATVNAQENAEYFVSNGQLLDLGYQIQYAGFTRVLTCTAPVNPGVENTVKVVVADTGDDSVDTVLAVTGGSLRSQRVQSDGIADPVSDATSWRYDNSGTDRGTEWRDVDYDDSAWQSGLGDFGHDEPVTTDIGETQPTAYFRAGFDVARVSDYQELTLRLFRDDGAVVYLNGTELGRTNMPDGDITFNTFATEVDPYDGQREIVVDVPASLLREGSNVLAVELHQSGTTGWISGDSRFRATLSASLNVSLPGPVANVQAAPLDASAEVSWDAPADDGGSPITKYTVIATPGGAMCETTGALSCVVEGLDNGTAYSFIVIAENQVGAAPQSEPSRSVTPGPGADEPQEVELITGATMWRWDNSGTDLGTGWREPGYDDSGWAMGRGDFGRSEAETDIGTTNPTAYFRTTFDVDDAAGYLNLAASMFRDDGVVVYLNGAEIGRSNMPAGEVTYDTFASEVDPFDGQREEVLTADPALLQDGSNVLAVELHQAGAPGWLSSDARFLLTLGGTYSPDNTDPVDAPGAPRSVAAVAGDAAAEVVWQEPESDGGADITSYVVTSAPDGQTCQTEGALSCQVEGLVNGRSYTFTVVAANEVGAGPASAPSDAVVPVAAATPPEAPSAPTATAGDGSADVAWQAPASDGGSPITGYTVMTAPGGSTCETDGALACTVTGLTNGTSYTFTVAAANALGTGDSSAPSNAVVPQGQGPQVLVPEDGPVSYRWDTAELADDWTEPDFDDSTWPTGPGPVGYGSAEVATDVSSDGFPDPRPLSIQARAAFTVDDPAAVSGLEVATYADDGVIVYLNGTEVVRRNLADGPVGQNSYATDAPRTDEARADLIRIPADAGLLRQGRNVLAIQASANYRSTPDLTLGVVLRSGIEVGAPGAPTGVRATAGDASATVSWEAPASDGGAPITGYTVTSEPGGEVCTTDGDLSCSVDGLANGTAYTFTVVAEGVGGEGPASAPSNSVTPEEVEGPEGWELFWSDEFDGTELDTSRWEAYDPSTNSGRYGEGDPFTEHCLTNENVAVADGYLTITSREERVTCKSNLVTEYSSGFISSRDADRYYPVYGRYEMRAKVPYGQGIFPAFWLRHVNGSSSAEVDVMETFFNSDPGASTSTVHFPKTIGYNVAKKGVFLQAPDRATKISEWHTWAVEIEPVYPDRDDTVKLTYYVDDAKILEYVNTKASQWADLDDQSRGFDIAINTALGQQDVGPTSKHLGLQWRDGGKCSLERPQRQTSNLDGCDDERTEGKWYNDTIPDGPAQDGVPDIWLAPWEDEPGAKAEYIVDYVRVYTR